MSAINLSEVRDRFPSYVGDDIVESILENGQKRDLKKNELLVSPGSFADEVYLIVKGSFIKNVLSSDNEERTVMFYTDNFFNYMVCSDSYVAREKTSYSLVANEKSIVLKISYNFVREALERYPAFARFYAYYHETSYAYFELTRDKNLSLTSEEYLQWLYANYPFMFKTFPSKSIASFIGVTPTWYSQLKRKLHK